MEGEAEVASGLVEALKRREGAVGEGAVEVFKVLPLLVVGQREGER